MQSQQPVPLSEHRFARFIIWLIALLGWLALGAPFRTQRRFSRHGATPMTTLRQAVRSIITIRAAEILKARPPAYRGFSEGSRDFCAPGFRRRVRRASQRAIFGGTLRRLLKRRGSFFEQAAHLLEVLRNHRALARRLAHLRRNLMSRLATIIMIAPPAEPCVSRAAPAAFAHDSS